MLKIECRWCWCYIYAYKIESALQSKIPQHGVMSKYTVSALLSTGYFNLSHPELTCYPRLSCICASCFAEVILFWKTDSTMHVKVKQRCHQLLKLQLTYLSFWNSHRHIQNVSSLLKSRGEEWKFGCGSLWSHCLEDKYKHRGHLLSENLLLLPLVLRNGLSESLLATIHYLNITFD